MGLFGKKPTEAKPTSPVPASNKKKRLEKGPNINATVKTEKPKKQTKADKERAKAVKFVQDTIPYESVFEDGIFVNKYGEYSKVYPIFDVNFRIEFCVRSN